MSDQYLRDDDRLRCIGCGKVPPVIVPSKVATGFGICHACAVAAADVFDARKADVSAFMESGRWKTPPGLTDDKPEPRPDEDGECRRCGGTGRVLGGPCSTCAGRAPKEGR